METDTETPQLDAGATLENVWVVLSAQAEAWLGSLMRPWSAYQLAIAAGLFLVAHLLAAVIRPRLSNWMHSREGWPKWRMRIFVIVRRRLRMIMYAALLWTTVLIMREITWPSRSYLIGVMASLSSAWLFVSFATRLINNSFLRAVVRYGAWIWATLHILRLKDEARAALDSIALHLGDSRISLWLLVQALVILAAFIAAARFITITSAAQIRRNEDISPSMQVLVVKILQATLYTGAIVVSLRLAGVDLTGLAVLSGAIGVGLGFGLQKVVSNLVSGIIILLDKSIKPGDVISLGETFGWINALGARYVSVVTRDGREYLIPNEDLITGQVVNWSHSSDFVRLDIYFGTAYTDDPHKVRRLAIEAATGVERVLAHPKPPVCHIVGFGDNSVDYILRFWISDPTGGLTNIRGNVYLALWDIFKNHDVSIPFPQREVRMLPDDIASDGQNLLLHDK